MENKFTIIAESTCDLSPEYIKKHNIEIIYLPYILNEVEYNGVNNPFLSVEEFYKKIGDGADAKTTQSTPQQVLNKYKQILSRNEKFIHLCLSSQISGCYQSADIAYNELKEKIGEFEGYYIDTKSGANGQGLLIDYVVKLREKGVPLDEVVTEVERMKMKVMNYFTIKDLPRLYKSGRLSKTAQLIGSALGIQPMLFLDETGKLIPVGKNRGRKNAIDDIIKRLGDNIDYDMPHYAFISHTCSIEEAVYVKDEIWKKYKIETKLISNVCETVGCHVGVGTIALFFFGKERVEKSLK